MIAHQLIFNVMRFHFVLLDGLFPEVPLAAESKGPFQYTFAFHSSQRMHKSDKKFQWSGKLRAFCFGFCLFSFSGQESFRPASYSWCPGGGSSLTSRSRSPFALCHLPGTLRLSNLDWMAVVIKAKPQTTSLKLVFATPP